MFHYITHRRADGRPFVLLPKDKVLKEIEQLPETIDSDELLERIYLISKIEKGLQDVEENNVVEHSEVKQRLGKWLD